MLLRRTKKKKYSVKVLRNNYYYLNEKHRRATSPLLICGDIVQIEMRIAFFVRHMRVHLFIFFSCKELIYFPATRVYLAFTIFGLVYFFLFIITC